jgi:hypothetical protein
MPPKCEVASRSDVRSATEKRPRSATEASASRRDLTEFLPRSTRSGRVGATENRAGSLDDLSRQTDYAQLGHSALSVV